MINKLTIVILAFLIVLPTLFSLNLASAQNWNISPDWETQDIITATPAPAVLVPSPIGATEIILVVLWLIFLLTAIITKEPLVAIIAAVFSFILGLDLGLIYAADNSYWMYGLGGFCIAAFGLWFSVYALTVANKGGRQK